MLVEALPYIQRFRGRDVVVKYGGNAMVDPALATSFAEDVVLMRSVGLRPVVVHGGGPQISDLMERLGKVPEFRDGQRVTDAETVDIARMVLVGKVNREIVERHQRARPAGRRRERRGRRADPRRAPATPTSGSSATSRPSTRPSSSGSWPRTSSRWCPPSAPTRPGRPTTSTPTPWPARWPRRSAPRRSSTSPTSRGCSPTSTTPTSLISRIDAEALQALLDDGTLTGGMIPKIAACLHAVANGVGSAHLLDGRLPHVVLLELFSDAGVGTMISGGAAA